MSLRTADEIARQKFGNQITTEQVQAFAHDVGLDKPVYERYGIWLSHFIRGDMGTSFVTNSSVADNVLPRFERTLILSALALVIAIGPYIARIARGSVREALGAAYAQAAVLRGLSRRTVVWDHAMRNAGVPLVNAVAINIVYLLSGVIVVENLFAFPGVGQGLVQATSTSDAFNVEAIALVMGAMFIGVSVAADLTV